MTYQLKKTENLDGEISFSILRDGEVHRTYSQKKYQHAETEARSEFKRVLERHKLGFPKDEILLTETI